MKAKLPAAPWLEGIKSRRCLKKVCQQASTSVEGEAPIPSPCKYKGLADSVGDNSGLVAWHAARGAANAAVTAACQGVQQELCVSRYAELACTSQQVLRRLSKLTGAYLEHSRGDMGASHQGSSSSDQVVSTPGPPL